MGDAENVKRLAAEAAKRQANKKTKQQPTVAKRIRKRKQDPPPKKSKPNAVLKLISDAMKRKGN